MLNRISSTILCGALLTILSGCSDSAVDLYKGKDPLFGEYFGEPVPDSVPVRFCPRFFSEELHSSPIFSSDGNEAYWTLMGEGYKSIMEMRRTGEEWSMPAESEFNLRNTNDAPFITPDGQRIYFLSSQGSGINQFDENIYFAIREDDHWLNPVKIPEIINSHPLHWQFSVAENYNLYFQDSESHELYYSRYVEGNYQDPVKLPETINSEGSNEGSPYISPEENFLIFDRSPPGSYTDLYISFKDSAGNWTRARGLGNLINTPGHETCPFITADMRYLFFLRGTDTGMFPFWIDAKSVILQ